MNDDPTTRIYCAGPLFNAAERDEMTAIADRLVGHGYAVYLPHRDGMEFRLILDVLAGRGFERAEAAAFLHAAIYALDVYQVAEACDAMVWNLNGRVPDEGAVAEAAMAFTLGKPLVAFSDDARSLIAGRVNPLLVGMVDFRTVGAIDQIVPALREEIDLFDDVPTRPLAPAMERAVADGQRLWQVMTDAEAGGDDEQIATVVADLFAPVDDVFAPGRG
ncbi:MAG: nucleoside 2-deoxyribosyltransferase [Planctomycetota bacterium]